MPSSSRVRLALRLLAILGILAFAGWFVARRTGPPPPPSGDPAIRHVIVVSIDTLRADMLGCYGNPRVATPNLDALAAESVLFESHIVAAPTTLASHTSLFTGTWPHTHGVPRNGYVVNADNVTLAEVLGRAGFDTAAFIGALPMSSNTGVLQGFAFIEEPRGPVEFDRHARRVTSDVLSWLADRDPSGPRTFLFVHLFDVHSPFSPRGAHRTAYVPDNPAVAAIVADPLSGTLDHVRSVRTMYANGDAEGPTHSRALQALYEGGVTATDSVLGTLFRGLRNKGWLDRSLVVVTADHGESFERPEEIWNHGYTLFDDTVRTPLIVRLPDGRGAGVRIGEVVSNVDVMPGILELVGIARPRAVEGHSFVPLLDGETGPRTAFSEATKPWVEHRDDVWTNRGLLKAARTSSHKLIWDPQHNVHQLFRLEADPYEVVDKWSEASDKRPARQLSSRLLKWNQHSDPHPTVPIDDPEARSGLEALGYVDHP